MCGGSGSEFMENSLQKLSRLTSLSCPMKTAKYILAVINVIFVLGGIALLVLGIIYELKLHKVTDALPNGFLIVYLAPTLTIILGSLIFVVAYFGCWGAIWENTCALYTFAAIILAILLAQIVLAILTFLAITHHEVETNNLDQQVYKKLKWLFKHYDENEQAKELVDAIQSQLKCCGLFDPYFWGNEIPGSCCGKKHECRLLDAYEDGCVPALTSSINSSMMAIGIAATLVAVVELLLVIMAICLGDAIRQTRRAEDDYY